MQQSLLGHTDDGQALSLFQLGSPQGFSATITNYGGTVHSVGTPYSQSFPADGFTARLIPEAATNVWTLTFTKDFSELTYHLTRHDKPRFTAVLKRVPSGG